MYSLIMASVSSQLGNKGEYERSDEISHAIIRESIKGHVAPYIHLELYNLLWNYEQKEKKRIPVIEMRNAQRDLQYCILLSRFCKLKFREMNYKNKLLQRIMD